MTGSTGLQKRSAPLSKSKVGAMNREHKKEPGLIEEAIEGIGIIFGGAILMGREFFNEITGKPIKPSMKSTGKPKSKQGPYKPE